MSADQNKLPHIGLNLPPLFPPYSSRLSIIRRLREEIEQIDTNLVRYNVKCESDEFVRFILQFSPEKESLVFTKIDSAVKKAAIPAKEKAKTSAPASAPTASTPAARANGATTTPTAATSAIANVPKVRFES